MSNAYLGTQIVPFIKLHKIGRLDIDCITVKLTPEEWDICDQSSANMWTNKKGGSYGKGLINTIEDPHFAERVGRIGEVAFSKISGLNVDLSYREKGDDQDFITKDGISIDVKTSSKCPAYKQMLITGEMRGKALELKSDYYVAAYLAHEDRINKKATVVIVGWCTREQGMAGGLKIGRKGTYYKNYEVHYRDLKPISELLEMINPELETVTIKEIEE